ncbi:hypothetical protein MLD38_008708 [Melastoma candidum]|uniref:Uncharacterized protein n=1 Tax=Melastoma candidum TaxID=119954 RepID=A0ACB9RWL3_9MYRT|nr:hypothetical protein MLD38_008708 [Melastoma candidum]
MVSQTKRLPEWMPMIERFTELSGDEGVPSYVRLVSGFIYEMKAGNVGLDGSENTFRVMDSWGGHHARQIVVQLDIIKSLTIFFSFFP